MVDGKLLMASCLAELATPSKKRLIVLTRFNTPQIAGTQDNGVTRGMTWI
jgi:hypothetical protein